MRKPLYTMHPGASVPSIPPQFSSPEVFAATLARFNARQYRVGRGPVLRLIDDYDDYTTQLRDTLEQPIKDLAESARKLEEDSDMPSDIAGCLGDIVGQLKHMRQSHPFTALEDLPGDPSVGPYITRLAQHYPEIKEVDHSSLRARLRSTLKTVQRDMQPSLAKEQEMNCNAFYEIVDAHDHILQNLTIIDSKLDTYNQRTAQRNQPLPKALGELHASVVSLVNSLQDKARQFSQMLEWQIGLLPTTQGNAIGR